MTRRRARARRRRRPERRRHDPLGPRHPRTTRSERARQGRPQPRDPRRRLRRTPTTARLQDVLVRVPNRPRTAIRTHQPNLRDLRMARHKPDARTACARLPEMRPGGPRPQRRPSNPALGHKAAPTRRPREGGDAKCPRRTRPTDPTVGQAELAETGRPPTGVTAVRQRTARPYTNRMRRVFADDITAGHRVSGPCA